MSRTFTLRRLFLNLTVLCLALGFMVSFPAFSVQLALTAAIAVPSLAASAVLAHLSTRPVVTAAAALFGALMVAACCPTPTICSPMIWWDLYVLRLGSMAIPAAAGAVVLGALALLIEKSGRWRWPWSSRRAYPPHVSFLIADRSDESPSDVT